MHNLNMILFYLYPYLNNFYSSFHYGDILPSNFLFCTLHFLLLHNSYKTSLLVLNNTNKFYFSALISIVL